MQNDGKRSAPIPMTPWRNSAIPRAADSLAETPPGSANPWREREMGEMEFRLSPHLETREFRTVDVRLWGPGLENVSFGRPELTYRMCPRELARFVTRLYPINLKTAAAMPRAINAQIISLSAAPCHTITTLTVYAPKAR